MRYHRPTSIEEAVSLAATAKGVTRFLAGGTDVLVQMRSGTVTPDDLIDLKSIHGAREIARTSDGGWRIGIAVSGAELGDNEDLRTNWPGVVEAMCLVGSTQVQGRATLTGNLCNASPAADSVPALVAAGAKVVVAGPGGSRELAVEQIPAGPGRTTLAPGELVSEIILPARRVRAADAYLRFIPRSEMDIAVVGCAVSLRLDGDIISEARVALGAVAPTVLLVPEAADAIAGTTLDEAALAALVAAVRTACKPISDRRGTAEYRIDIAGVLARRVANKAYDRAKGVMN